MAIDKTIKLAEIYSGLVKAAGYGHQVIGPAIRNANLNQQLMNEINAALKESVKNEPYPSGNIMAKTIRIDATNSDQGWSVNSTIIWPAESTLQNDPKLKNSIANAAARFQANINRIAKQQLDRIIPTGDNFSEEIYYNPGGEYFISGGI